MGNNNPGRYKKEGREAFMPGVGNPEDYFNYPKDSWLCKYYIKDFLEGWNEAEKDYKAAETVQEKFDKYYLLKERVNELAADPELIDVLTDILTLIERNE